MIYNHAIQIVSNTFIIFIIKHLTLQNVAIVIGKIFPAVI